MNAPHTQTKLAHRFGRIFSVDRENLTIANIARAHDGDYSEANARRLVACWNACEGLSTEALERLGTLDRARVALDVVRVQAIAQRDELLAALESVALVYRNAGGKEWEAARAAIAKVKAER